uniref:Uncharacterized protein n=1 Tax=Romanomermis culicivorax TaxID=13658 RepID=A0A915IFA3_ROMCU
MIGSIYQADWIGFARNAFFFGMSITLSNVGERLVAYGVGKKLAGNVLGGRFASSVGACLPKIGFDVYMGYQLFEDIKNNQTTSAAFTSTYLALDLLECGLETAAEFELITLSSTFLAGLGIVGFLTFLAMDITKSVMAVNKMDEIIPLTNAEKVFEGTLEFFNLGPNPILKKMAQEVTANEAIVFMALHHYPKVNRFLISEAQFDGALAYFAKRYTNPIIDYLCRNAFGIMRKGETEFPVTLFLLYNGTDSVTGFPTASNTFLLMNGEKMINGGSSNDQFLIQGENIFGYLNGSDGTDIVDFSAMGGTDIVLRIGDSEAYLSSMDQPAQYKLKLYSIEGVLGRRGLQDYISVCNETQIDLGGGLANDHDFIEISSSTCENKKLTIILNNYTFVGCSVDDITVYYQAADQVGASFQLDRGEHVFYIKMARIVETKFSIAPDFNMILFGTRGKLIMTIGEAAKVNFIFEQENIVAKIDDHNLTMYLVGKYDLFNIVENYAEYIKQNPHIKLLADTEQGVVILNHYSFAMKINNEIKMANLATNGRHTNMVLIGHRGVENYFQISSEADNFNDTLLNITIYPNLSENFTCFIDLHNLTLMIHQTTRGIYGLRMYPEKIEDNIKLKIFTSNNVDHMISERLIGEITIIDGFRYLDQITVHLYNNNNFVQHDDLSLIPETMHTNQTMVLISAGNFDFGAKIKFEYPASYLTSFKFEESLLITNVESMRGNATNYPISILLTDYFRYPNKFDSLMLIFENFVISGLNATVVKHAPSIKTMWLDMNQKLDNVDSGWDDDYEYDYDDEAENAYDDRRPCGLTVKPGQVHDAQANFCKEKRC